MKTIILSTIIGSALLISCTKNIGCRDINAINFDPNAVQACDACCQYETEKETVYVNNTQLVIVDESGGPNPSNLTEMEAAITGCWEGICTTPWVSPYPVNLYFSADGTYAGHSTAGIYPAFYYGTDDNSPLKVYDLTTTYMYNNQIAASGEIDIVFQLENVNQDEIEHVQFSNNADSLHFDFIHSGQYGPVEYALKRM